MTKKKDPSEKKPETKKPPEQEKLVEAEHILTRAEKKEAEVSESRVEWEIRKDECKTAKAAYQERLEELRRLIRARKEKHPLFDKAGKKVAKKDGDQPLLADGANADWKARPLADLLLPERYTLAIGDAGYTTLGKLSAHMADQGEWWAKEIKGLGEKGRDETLEAFQDFWKRHPECCEVNAA